MIAVSLPDDVFAYRAASKIQKTKEKLIGLVSKELCPDGKPSSNLFMIRVSCLHHTRERAWMFK